MYKEIEKKSRGLPSKLKFCDIICCLNTTCCSKTKGCLFLWMQLSKREQKLAIAQFSQFKASLGNTLYSQKKHFFRSRINYPLRPQQMWQNIYFFLWPFPCHCFAATFFSNILTKKHSYLESYVVLVMNNKYWIFKYLNVEPIKKHFISNKLSDSEGFSNRPLQ